MGCSWHWVVAGGTLFKLTCLDWKVVLESMHFKIGRVVIHGQLVCPTSFATGCSLWDTFKSCLTLVLVFGILH